MDSFKKPLCVTGQLHAPWMFSHLDGKRLKDRKTADMRQVRLPLSERTGAGRQSEPRSSLIQSWKTGGLRDIDIAQHTLTTRFIVITEVNTATESSFLLNVYDSERRRKGCRLTSDLSWTVEVFLI